MKILIVSKVATHPTTAGNRQWILAQVSTLRRLGHDVHFLYVQDIPIRCPAKRLQHNVTSTSAFFGDHFHHFRMSLADRVRMCTMKYLRLAFCHRHRGVDDEYPFGLARVVNKIDARERFDVCIVNYYYLTRLFRHINIPKKAIATHDCMAYRNLKTQQKTYCLTAHAEAIAMQRCPHIFALQDVEAHYFQLLSPNSQVYTLYGHFVYHPQPVTGNKNLLFLSSDNVHNIDGIRWFAVEIWPAVKRAFADARLLIAGSIGKAVKELAAVDGVEMRGYVDDISAFYALGDVAINPVRQGTGLKIKSFEALSYDKVAIVHPHSTEGVFDKDTAPLLVARSPEEWVATLATIWGHEDTITGIKARNKDYLRRMSEFIDSEYVRFLESPA